VEKKEGSVKKRENGEKGLGHENIKGRRKKKGSLRGVEKQKGEGLGQTTREEEEKLHENQTHRCEGERRYDRGEGKMTSQGRELKKKRESTGEWGRRKVRNGRGISVELENPE